MAVAVAVRRHDAVLIRVSTQGQDEKPQIANCKNLLIQRDVDVPAKHWYQFKISRRKVLTGSGFEVVMDEVKAGKIRDIYVESQDRFGGKSNKELFSVLKILQDNGVRLIDLTNNRDLTSDEFIDEINTLFEGMKSVKELKDTSRRSIRSRVNNFKATGSWPTGGAPFGYGKRCFKPDGQIRWEWFPTLTRSKGEIWYPSPKGKLALSDSNTAMPRKEREDKIFLVPHRDKKIIKAVKTLFDLFANHGMSHRGIAIRLNELGFRNYEKPFTFALIGQFLKNPAYMGDTCFGKNQTGVFHSFDAEGNIIALNAKELDRQSQQIVRTGTHPAIIDKKTWTRTCDRFARESKEAETQRKNPPRSPEHYLKNLLVCGHCGKGMTGRTETHGDRTVKYVCGSYNISLSNGAKCECGFQTITHAKAEELIFAKLAELGIERSEVTGKKHKKALGRRIEEKLFEGELNDAQIDATIDEGVASLIHFLHEHYELSIAELNGIKKRLRRFYLVGRMSPTQQMNFPIAMADLKKAVKEAEAMAVEKSASQLAKAKAEHEQLTLKWVLLPEARQAALEPHLKRLEQEMEDYAAKSKTVSERLREHWDSYADWREEYQALLTEYQSMDSRMRGESLRRIFESITLYWDRTWHEAESTPSRERKTNRPGRWQFTINTSKIAYKTRHLHLIGSW